MNKTFEKIKYFFIRLSIKNQLILIILIINAITLIFSISFSIYYSIANIRENLEKNARLEAKLIGEYCISPLIFGDKKGADEILKKLRNIPFVEKAFLFNSKNEIFSFFSKEKNNYSLKSPSPTSIKPKEGFFKTEVPIIFNKKRIGTIILIASTESAIQKARSLLFNNMVFFITALLFSYFLAIIFQKLLSKPILRLAKESKNFAEGKSFDFEKIRSTNREVSILSHSFIEMIKKIEEREKRLNKAIRALRDSESKYRRFFEHDVSAIIIFSFTGKVIDCNSTFLELFGFKNKKDAKAERFQSFCVETSCFEAIKAELSQNGKIINKEIKMINVKEKKLIILANFFIEKKTKKRRIIGYLFDITQRKQYEEQFLHSQKMASIGTFVGGVAHDFNNILTTIKGYSEMVLKNIKKENRYYKNLKTIYEASEKAENLIKKLLFLSKKEIAQPKVFNLNMLINDLKKMLESLIGEEIELKTELAEDLPNLYADQSQIEQVLINLIANSRDALNETKKKKKEIIIKTKYVKKIEKTFKENIFESGHYVVLSISDNGIGMSEEVKKKAFEPFFTTKERGKGTGLGLSTVFGIIQQNKGKIHLYSEKGIGTTIRIYLPAVFGKEVKVGKNGEKTVKKVKHFEGKKILVVEDDPNVRNFAIDVLKDLGYDVNYATNGKEGLEFIKNKGRVDLIITDVIMPEMNGYDFIKEVKKIYSDVKVIFMSGYTDGYLIDKGKIQKGVNFLSKPFSFGSLSEIVSKILMEK